MADMVGVKRYFLRGLAALLPTIVTIWMFVWGYRFIQKNIGIHINKAIVYLLMLFQGDQPYYTKEQLLEVCVDGYGSIAGFVIALIVVCAIGLFLASVLGKALWRMVENFIIRTPFLRGVYPYVKQVTDFVLTGGNKLSFSRVVAVEYPRKGIWSIGLVTGSGLKKVKERSRKEFLTVLVPTSPTPFTGFVIMVPRKDVIDLDMTIEEALRFNISGGLINPEAKLNNGSVATPPATDMSSRK